MKKIILSSISLILVAAITLVALAATTGLTNDKIEKMKETKFDNGSAFKVSNAAAPKYTNAEGQKAVDGDTATVWSTTKKGSYTQLTFKEPTSINNVHITEVAGPYGENANVTAYHLEAWNGKQWIPIYYNQIIEGYYCADIDPIQTLAIRLYIDDVKNASAPAQISELSANYQRPIEFDKEFINATYAVPNWIVAQKMYDQNITNPEYLDNLTDLYLNADFAYDKFGNFVINRPQRGGNSTVDIIYPWKEEDKQQTYDFMIGGMDKLPDITYGDKVDIIEDGTMGVLPFVESKYGEKSNPKLWITMGTLNPSSAIGDVGGIKARDFTAFSDPAKRTMFIKQVVDFMVEYEIHGIDFDWEYPGNTEMWRAFGSLISELADAVHAVNKEIGSAQFSYDYGLTATEINKLDRINMMSYDQRGSSKTMSHHASYNGATVQDINRYINEGCDPEKLVLGTAWYTTSGNCGWIQVYEQYKGMGTSDLEIRGINFKGAIGSVDGINGPNLCADRVLYAIKRKIGGVFSFQSICDVVGYEKESLGRAQDEVLAKYITYKEGTAVTDHSKKSTKYTDLLKSGAKDPSKK